MVTIRFSWFPEQCRKSAWDLLEFIKGLGYKVRTWLIHAASLSTELRLLLLVNHKWQPRAIESRYPAFTKNQVFMTALNMKRSGYVNVTGSFEC